MASTSRAQKVVPFRKLADGDASMVRGSSELSSRVSTPVYAAFEIVAIHQAFAE